MGAPARSRAGRVEAPGPRPGCANNLSRLRPGPTDTFGVSALPLAALRFIERGQTGPTAVPAAPLFAKANLIVGWIAVRTLLLAILRTTLCPTTATEPLDRRSWGRPQRPEENVRRSGRSPSGRLPRGGRPRHYGVALDGPGPS